MNTLAKPSGTGVPSSTEDGKAPPRIPFVMVSRPLLADKALLPSDKVILAAMLQLGYASGLCTASNDTIGDACGISGRSVSRRLPELSGWITIVRVEQSEANPVGREIRLDWITDHVRHPQKRMRRTAGGGVDKLATGVGGQVGYRIRTLTLSTGNTNHRSPLVPATDSGKREEEKGISLSGNQRQRKCKSAKASPLPSDNKPDRPADPQDASPPPPPPDQGVHHRATNNGLWSITFRRDGVWQDHRTIDDATHEAMLDALGGLAHDHKAVAKWFVDCDARQHSQGVQAVNAQAAVMDGAELQERYDAEGIDLIRAESVMGVYLKGGRAQAIKYLTPLMLRFLAEQGGKLADFAETLERDGVSAGPTGSEGFVVPKKHVDDAVQLAALLTESHDRKYVDPLADQLVKCFGDTKSRSYFCGVGHSLVKGELSQLAFRDALAAALQTTTQVEFRVRLFIALVQKATRQGPRKRPEPQAARSPGRFLQRTA